MIYLLMVLLCILLWIIFILNKKDLIAPAFIFCASFCFACFWSTMYAKKWELGLHSNTFWVILGGVLEFFAITLIVKGVFYKIKGKQNTQEENKLEKIKIENWKKIIFLIFCIFTSLYTIYSIVKLVNGDFGNIGNALDKYNSLLKFSKDPVLLPKLLNLCRYAVKGAGYWFAYVYINNYLVEKKVDFLSIGIVIMSMMCEMATGSRGGAMNILIAIIAYIFLLMSKKNTFKKRIRIRTIMIFAIVGIIVLYTFQATGSLLGRKASSSASVVSMNSVDYLAVYCGAEIKNLDLFLQEEHKNDNEIWGSQTFISLIRWMGPKFGVENSYYQADLPFRRVNNFSLGNVYTTFYPYIYDFGYGGMIVLVGIMAAVVQTIYEICKRKKVTNKPAMSILIYGYIFHTLVLSFFSNKFYENTLTRNCVIVIPLCWILYEIFFCRVKLRRKYFNKI